MSGLPNESHSLCPRIVKFHFNQNRLKSKIEHIKNNIINACNYVNHFIPYELSVTLELIFVVDDINDTEIFSLTVH